MLIIPVKEGESIEKALKKYKKKFERTGTMKQLACASKVYKAISENREQRLKAIYKNQMYGLKNSQSLNNVILKIRPLGGFFILGYSKIKYNKAMVKSFLNILLIQKRYSAYDRRLQNDLISFADF